MRLLSFLTSRFCSTETQQIEIRKVLFHTVSSTFFPPVGVLLQELVEVEVAEDDDHVHDEEEDKVDGHHLEQGDRELLLGLNAGLDMTVGR